MPARSRADGRIGTAGMTGPAGTVDDNENLSMDGAVATVLDVIERRKMAAGQPLGIDDYARQMRALGAQVDDPEALWQALEVRDALDAAVAAAVDRLRAEGYSDAALAAPAGISRQAVRQRWPHRSAARP